MYDIDSDLNVRECLGCGLDIENLMLFCWIERLKIQLDNDKGDLFYEKKQKQV